MAAGLAFAVRRARVYARAVVAVALLVAIAAAAGPVSGQSGAVDYEWGEARRNAPQYTLRRITLEDGTTITRQNTVTWPTITVASWQSSRVSSMAALVNNGSIILYRASRHSVYRIAGSSQTTVAGLGGDIYYPSVALIDGALYVLDLFSGSQPRVRRIANIAGGNTGVETLYSTNRGWPFSDTNSYDVNNVPRGTWIGHNRIWGCAQSKVRSWDLPTTAVTALTGQQTYTRPSQMPCTETTVPSLVPIDGGRFLMQVGYNLYIWNPSDGAVTRLAVDNVSSLQSIFPSPFGAAGFFTSQTPAITSVDTDEGDALPNGERPITVRLSWQVIPGATGYELERDNTPIIELDALAETYQYVVNLPPDSQFAEERIRMRAVLSGGASGGTFTVGGQTVRLAPGEIRYSPWTGRYEYPLIGDSFQLSPETADQLPASQEPQEAIPEVIALITQMTGLNHTQSSILSPFLLFGFAVIVPGMMVTAAPRSPLMLGAACLLFCVTWLYAGWTWFGLDPPFLGLPILAVAAIGYIVIKNRGGI